VGRGSTYFSLGAKALEAARSYLERYFHWLGRDEAEAIARDALTNGQAIERYLASMRAAGCD
jgi:hypothetical protein